MQNRDAFGGKELIAKQLTTENLSIAKDKRVVVIGSAKSALDVAGAAGEVAESVTMVCRQVGRID
jgi:cation diffusion facilitator CzcD-associated flavoprotein CzcO